MRVGAEPTEGTYSPLGQFNYVIVPRD